MPEAQQTHSKAPITLPADLTRHRLLDSEQAATFLGYSLAHFRRLYRTGKVPAPIKINGRKTHWSAGTLLDFVADAARKVA